MYCLLFGRLRQFRGPSEQHHDHCSPDDARCTSCNISWCVALNKSNLSRPSFFKIQLQLENLSTLSDLQFVLFMLVYYRLLAIIVVIGITLSGLVQWNVISLLSSTNGLALSLAGIAGIIVSIGVTVDSYVVFFERLKDELVSGKTMRGAAQRSFTSAWRTILAADTVSFIGAIILWQLTVGSVRGFAFFLGLSTLIDVFVAYLFTRPAILLLARSKFMAGRNVLGVVVPKEVTV